MDNLDSWKENAQTFLLVDAKWVKPMPLKNSINSVIVGKFVTQTVRAFQLFRSSLLDFPVPDSCARARFQSSPINFVRTEDIISFLTGNRVDFTHYTKIPNSIVIVS